jgi:hypothetical protein
MNQVLMSHFNQDEIIAKELSELIHRVSLHQINPWYSSDKSGTGGIGVGENWINTIRQRLLNSKAVVALITPKSVHRPWIYFESGFGAASSELEVIPVCIGIDSVNSVPFPLAMYQSFQLTDSNSVESFLEKLFAKFEITFDKEMSKTIIQKFVDKIVEYDSTNWETDEKEPNFTQAIDEIKQHIDRRFVNFSKSISQEKNYQIEYSVPLYLDLEKNCGKVKIQIREGDTVQDKLDTIYLMIKDSVKPCSYLKEWILIECQTETKLIIKEVQEIVPADIIFRPGTAWIIKKLVKPYQVEDSDGYYER